ncbi:hypothetical protein [Thermococcus thioreducens]|uniref:hypothetical protein n=1 Tax=Thermococcus thioreducens TaxID=277988 RepID=UPI00117BF018|nr:hypothetical protein [Thermococcus thioreducens]
MIEPALDLSRLESNLARSAMYIFPKDFPDNETLVKMTKSNRCITFIELSRNALKGTANISAVREGLEIINEFTTECERTTTIPVKSF